MIMALNDGLALGCAVDGHIGNLAHELRQSSAVVALVVLHDYCVDGLEVHNLLEACHKLAVIWSPHGVDEHSLLVLDEIRVIA